MEQPCSIINPDFLISKVLQNCSQVEQALLRKQEKSDSNKHSELQLVNKNKMCFNKSMPGLDHTIIHSLTEKTNSDRKYPNQSHQTLEVVQQKNQINR